jgi:hypothetical protein
MNVTAELDAMRAEIPGCALVAFTDLATDLALCTSAVRNPVQEEMNALSQAARIALDGAFAEGAASAWGRDHEDPAEVAMLLTGEEARVFIRSPGKPNEALICVCAPDAPLEDVVARGQTALTRIVAQS